MVYWMQELAETGMKKGALRRQLQIPADKTIPMTFLRVIVKTPIGGIALNPTQTGKHYIMVTRLVKQRANLAIRYKETEH